MGRSARGLPGISVVPEVRAKSSQGGDRDGFVVSSRCGNLPRRVERFKGERFWELFSSVGESPFQLRIGYNGS